MITILIHLTILLNRAIIVSPVNDLPHSEAFVHGLAAVLASSDEISEFEIIKIARRESGFWVDARPRMKHWSHNPKKFPKLRHYVCGLMQATAKTPTECVSWMNPFVGYLAGADQMREWHEHCRRIGRFSSRRYKCARAGYRKGSLAARLAI